MYETGLLVAFLIWTGQTIAAIVRINSLFEKNLNKVGMRRSWTTGKTVDISSKDAARPWYWKVLKFLLIYGLGLLTVLLSWLYVAASIGMLIHNLIKAYGEPQVNKEFRWRLRNQDLSFDQLVKELMAFKNVDGVSFEQFREDVIKEMKQRRIMADIG